MTRLRTILTGKIIKYLEEQSKTNSKEYLDFIDNYARFIREGIYSDRTNAVCISAQLHSRNSCACLVLLLMSAHSDCAVGPTSL